MAPNLREALKRKLNDGLRVNCESIPQGQTAIKVMLVHIRPSAGKSASYRSLICRSLMNKAVSVDYAVPGKKARSGGESYEEAAPEVEDDGDAGERFAVIQPGSEFLLNCFGRSVAVSAKLEESNIFQVSLVAGRYGGRDTFKTDKIMIDPKHHDPLDKDTYRQYILKSSLSEIPTRFNLRPEDFPPDMHPKGMNRRFVLPLSQPSSAFSNILLFTLDDALKPSQMCLKNKDGQSFIGFNREVGPGETANQIGVAYEPIDPKEPIVSVLFNVLPPETPDERSIYDVFGITSIDAWEQVGVRMALCARDWLAYGYSNYDRIMRMRANLEEGDDPESSKEVAAEVVEHTSGQRNEEIVYSTGLILRTKLNLAETVRMAGMELSRTYVDVFLDSVSYETPDGLRHPCNEGFRISLDRKQRGSVFNLTEMDDAIRASFFKLVAKHDVELKFYGVFPSEDLQVMDGTEADLLGANKAPVVVFAIIQ